MGEAARRPLYVGTAYSNCESHQLQRNLSDRSTGVFNGKFT
jgi:hypothetical protein